MDFGHYKALVIDDEDTVRTVIVENLLSMGFAHVDEAANGEQALARIGEGDYDIAFLDLAMPGVPGDEVAHLALGMKPDLVIIVITGFATLERAITLMRRGIYDLIRKPFTREELEEKVAAALGKFEELRLETLHQEEYVGPYKIVEEVASGGGGIVYRARKRDTGEEVALKILLSGPLASEEKVLRFHREASTVLGLRHPCIVSVRDVGSHNDKHYIAMDFIEGRSLEDLIQRKELTFASALSLGVRVAEAVAYAHGQGVLHRDLKPSNIIVDRCNAPHIIDFGLAKSLGEKARITKSYRLYGTLGYIAPERFTSAEVPDSVRMDVFSLGVLLYEMLLNTVPYRIDSAGEFLPNFCAPPVPPREMDPRIPEDVSGIVLKALACLPEDRYPTAADLAADLRVAAEGSTTDFPLLYN